VKGLAGGRHRSCAGGHHASLSAAHDRRMSAAPRPPGSQDGPPAASSWVSRRGGRQSVSGTHPDGAAAL